MEALGWLWISRAAVEGGAAIKRLKDIAAETGYSIKTVSRAIHDHPDIKQETRERIMEVVRRRGFTPQWAAQSLRIRSTHTIGFAVPNLVNGFFGEIAMTIDAHFRQARYSTLICFTAKSYQTELESLASLVSKNVDGIIFAPSGSSGAYFRDLPQLREKPLVLIDNRCQEVDGWQVLHDNRFGMKLLADHLLERGRRRIGLDPARRPFRGVLGRRAPGRLPRGLARHGLRPRRRSWSAAPTGQQVNGGYEATLGPLSKERHRVNATCDATPSPPLGGYKAIHGAGPAHAARTWPWPASIPPT